MCLSGITQTLYGIIMAGSAVLAIIALFTPDWNTVKNVTTSTDKSTLSGLMPWSCIDNSSGTTCQDWWANLQDWLRWVVVCMILAIIVEVFAVVYNFLTCLACCCKKYIIHPLTFFALVSTVLLLVAVIVYAANYSAFESGVNLNSQLGYSFWLAVGSLVLSAAAVILGAVSVFFGEHCC